MCEMGRNTDSLEFSQRAIAWMRKKTAYGGREMLATAAAFQRDPGGSVRFAQKRSARVSMRAGALTHTRRRRLAMGGRRHRQETVATTNEFDQKLIKTRQRWSIYY